jgi:hypothetical protein
MEEQRMNGPYSASSPYRPQSVLQQYAAMPSNPRPSIGSSDPNLQYNPNYYSDQQRQYEDQAYLNQQRLKDEFGQVLDAASGASGPFIRNKWDAIVNGLNGLYQRFIR